MRTVAKLIGGSHLYGLETPTSDIDERFIFVNEEPEKIIGLDSLTVIDNREQGVDNLGYEYARFISLLRKTNTQVVEFLFADEEKFSILEPAFKELRINRMNLINPHAFYSSLRGYISGELRLANGDRTGRLGGKRKEQLDKYGFSPKNFSHLLRLSFCGEHFFKTGLYPVNIRNYNPALGELIYSIKVNPEQFTKEQLNKLAAESEQRLILSYEANKNRAISKFDMAIANRIILNTYFPILKHAYENQK